MSGTPTHENDKECIALIGRQRVGKSSLIHAMIRAYKNPKDKNKKGGAVVVLAPHPEQFGKDGVLCDVNNASMLVQGIMDTGFSGLVVFDDCDNYMNSKSNGVITAFCTTFRHYGCDIVLSTRSPQQVNINLRRCFSRICVFQMHEPRAIKSTKELLGEFPKAALKRCPPREPFVYFDFNLETYEVQEKKTVPVKAAP
jgi:hypothetical protein